ncbi:LLM class flavin-dependent oxidoreductase [Spirillospora sp. NBC_01491]|uniref:LLM class flavin-dependent oxidoreductase n=1 Tax=Spirillospora sp. NBC_01491 TaxID=2976007 RepID=UPI002E32A61C|nr:LLM class flavin-dependent oxidoreductase [Spirillospora sp. NBC_01491]
MPLFGYGPSAAVTAAPQVLRDAVQADHDGLDLFTIPDHPYYGERLDAYATMGVVLGRTTRITAVSTVTNLPARPAPMLARSRPCRPCRTGGWCWGSAPAASGTRSSGSASPA